MKKALLIIVGLVVLVLLGTQLMSNEWKVTRSTVIQAKPQTLYPLVANWKNWEKWSGFTTPDMKCEYSGAKSGVGAVCVVKDKDMEVTNEIVKADPKTGIVYECRVTGFNKADCSLTFTPEGKGTKVDFTYLGTHGRNPMHRLMGLMVDKMLGAPLEKGLANLKSLAEGKK